MKLKFPVLLITICLISSTFYNCKPPVNTGGNTSTASIRITPNGHTCIPANTATNYEIDFIVTTFTNGVGTNENAFTQLSIPGTNNQLDADGTGINFTPTGGLPNSGDFSIQIIVRMTCNTCCGSPNGRPILIGNSQLLKGTASSRSIIIPVSLSKCPAC